MTFQQLLPSQVKYNFLNFSATTFMRMQSQMAGTSVKSMFWKALTVTWETKWIIQGKKRIHLRAWKAYEKYSIKIF